LLRKINDYDRFVGKKLEDEDAVLKIETIEIMHKKRVYFKIMQLGLNKNNRY